MSKEQKALDEFLNEYLFLCEKLHTNMQEKMLLDCNSPYNILKQAFTKAPEPIQAGIDLGVIKPKQYLKWEDLETTKIYKCLLNSNEYVVDYFPPQECDPYWRARLISPNRGVFIILKENYDKQLFDDLHLEVTEVVEWN